ncbi:MAG: AAA family ATPase [Rickettsiales bacterium]|jgi:RecA/RadA recombinase|nr:AAA family ATPase [Rickettsiales bacterium]
MADKTYNLKYFDSVQSRPVEWLWYLYIPYGKITIVQGDPGDGKTTFVLNLAARLTKGQELSESKDKRSAITVIYLNAEDGIEDTIKPRLESVYADCMKVAYLEYDGKPITLADDRVEQAVIRSDAKLLVFDPSQGFVGDADMNRAGDIRAVMQKTATLTDKTGCTVLLVGHMNKTSGGKGIYRGFGSIDLAATARSMILVDRVKDNADIRAVVHIKSNLAPEGKPIAFELSDNCWFRWIEGYSITQDKLLGDQNRADDVKMQDAIKLLIETLQEGKITASELYEICKVAGIGSRTVESAKSMLGIKSIKHQGKWYWEFPTNKAGETI